MNNYIDVLQSSKCEGNIVRLPDTQLDRKVYVDVKNALEKIGGKWKGGKVQGFVFESDPSDLLTEIAGGKERNIKKEYQFFATPPDLAARMVEMADIKVHHEVLEPSAGRGAIVNAMLDKLPFTIVYGYELMEQNREHLAKISAFELLGEDFLTCERQFDRIVANPPFTKNQDIDHIRKMYECLKEGGVMVTISSTSWSNGSQKKQSEFDEWINSLDSTIELLPAGTFKESGTMVGGLLIRIYK